MSAFVNQSFLFLTVFVAASSPAFLARLPAFAKDGANPRQPFYVLLAAVIVALVVYVPLLKLLSGKVDPIGASLLLGMLSVLPMTMHTSSEFPPLQNIAIVIFLFYYFSSLQ